MGPLRLPRRHFLPLVFLPALSGFFYFQGREYHPRRFVGKSARRP
nr:MAG TPA_asm: hypothetical protein [Caudoviricetes sp.]